MAIPQKGNGDLTRKGNLPRDSTGDWQAGQTRAGMPAEGTQAGTIPREHAPPAQVTKEGDALQHEDQLQQEGFTGT